MAANTFSRHHALVVALLLFVLILGVAAYVLQRNEVINTIAGEAIRQKINAPPPSDLGLAPAKDAIIKTCPGELIPKDQDWDLPGWKVVPWHVINVQCSGKIMSCTYGEPLPSSNFKEYQADHLTFRQYDVEVDNCIVLEGPGVGYSCECQKAQKSVSSDKIN